MCVLVANCTSSAPAHYWLTPGPRHHYHMCTEILQSQKCILLARAPTAAYSSGFGPISGHQPAPLGWPVTSPPRCVHANHQNNCHHRPPLLCERPLGETAATGTYIDSQSPQGAFEPGSGPVSCDWWTPSGAYLKLAPSAMYLNPTDQTAITDLHCHARVLGKMLQPQECTVARTSAASSGPTVVTGTC